MSRRTSMAHTIKDSQSELAVEEEMKRKMQWVTTMPSGERLCTKLDGTKIKVKNALVSTATDPKSQQVRAHSLIT